MFQLSEPDFLFKLKIVLSFLQIGSAVTTGIIKNGVLSTMFRTFLDTDVSRFICLVWTGVIIAWPHSYKVFVSYFSIANLDFIKASSVDCVVPTTYYAKFLAMSIAPIGIVAAVFFVYLLPKRLGYFFKGVY